MGNGYSLDEDGANPSEDNTIGFVSPIYVVFFGGSLLLRLR